MSIRRALAAGASRVHYLDFDRALHWAASMPRELPRVLRIVARDPRAPGRAHAGAPTCRTTGRCMRPRAS